MSRLRLIFGLTGALALSLPAVAQELTLPPPEEFVKGDFYHGMPFAVAQRYGPEDVAPLKTVLNDKNAQASWENTVWLLGVIGSEEAEAELIDFLENRFEGAVSAPVMQALVLVNQALGFRAHDPETRSFEYLVEGTNPTTWQSRELRWTYEGWPEGSPDILMAKLSANGLGLAGNAAGRAHLEDLARRLPHKEPELWRFLGPNVEEAIALSGRIEQYGYRRVFAGEDPPQEDER